MASHRVLSRLGQKGRGAGLGGALAAVTAISLACTASPGSADDCRTWKPQAYGPGTTAIPRAPRRGVSWTLPRQFEHVLLVVFENQDYDSVVLEAYFRKLARRGALFTHYNAIFHPSYGNYLALIGGGYFATTGDRQSDIPRPQRTIADLLEAKGLTWRQYAEGYPGHCYREEVAAGGRYVRKHVPFLSFDSIALDPSRCASIVPAAGFDRRTLPNFAFYSPDICHDGHDLCPTGFDRVMNAIRGAPGARFLGMAPPRVHQSARWLEGFLEPILADAAVMKDTLVVLTFDESGQTENNHIYTVFLGGMVRPGARIDTCHDHYDLLRTIEDNFGIGDLGGEDAKSDPIVDGVWRAGG
jgi:hypothetical protein